MIVYACYRRLQAIQFWNIISEDVIFITDDILKAQEWENRSEKVSKDGEFVHIRYYKEFELQ